MRTALDEADFIANSIDNTSLLRTPTLPIATNTITCNHFSIPLLTPDMSDYQSSGRDFSDADCKFNLCRSRGQVVGHNDICASRYNDDWEHTVSYSEDNEFQEVTPPTAPQQSDCATLTTIDPTIMEWYTPLTVAQIVLDAWKEDTARMYEHYKQHKPDHSTNCNHEYCKTYHNSQLNPNRYWNPNFTTCLVWGTWRHGGMPCGIVGLMLEMQIKPVTVECNHTKAQALGLLP